MDEEIDLKEGIDLFESSKKIEKSPPQVSGGFY